MTIIDRTFHTVGRAVKGAVTATAEVPAPALAMSAIGLFGLVDWPVVVAVSGSAFVLHRAGLIGNKAGPIEATEGAAAAGAD